MVMTQESRLSQEADASDVTPLDDVTSFGESPLTPLTMTALDASPALAKDDGDDVTTRDDDVSKCECWQEASAGVCCVSVVLVSGDCTNESVTSS